MKKKWIIALSVVLVVVVTIVTLSFTLFTVQNFKIDMRTGSSYDYNEQEIFASSQLQTGKNIFFLNKTQASSNVEKAYPYLKVINIETQFPSTLVFHLAERQAFYAVRSGEGWLYLDEDLKVLESVAAPENVVVVGAEVQASEGDFVELALLKEFFDALLMNNRSREEGLATFDKLEYFESENEVYLNQEQGLKLTLDSGRAVFIHNAGYGLAYKLAKFYAVIGSIYQLAGSLPSEIIENSEIHINNFIGSNYSERDSYFYLVYQGERVEL